MQLLLNSLVSLIIRKLFKLRSWTFQRLLHSGKYQKNIWDAADSGDEVIWLASSIKCFGEAWPGVLQDRRYYDFPCGLDPIIGHFIANMPQKKNLQNLALSKNGMWPYPLWLLCHYLKYLVEVTNSVLLGLGRFHERMKRVEETQV